MKKKNKSRLIENFPPAILYLDDIERIVAILERSFDTVSVSTEEFDEVTSEELLKLASQTEGERFNRLQIKCREPHINLEFLPYKITAYISDERPETIGAIELIKGIIHSRKRRLFRLVKWSGYVVPGVLVGLFISEPDKVLAFGALISAILIGILSFRYEMSSSVIVKTTTKSDTPNILSRNSESLIVAILAALVGSVVSYVLTKYL
ncbi:hypothetical protein D8T39_21485 [Vibrio vulnificus]|uniref:hypothetical protein n=1 Tax=Vibrio vulnificus TaxID=672 RepID=UPI001028DB8F|nr:hypothetical protein [Vibrio vulnificus]EGQ7997855.1 hypothetical protein [Vibrio vulnificus]RZQ06382.1 hypothetical protein D8T39_21485 [Vibrio vulnificus]